MNWPTPPPGYCERAEDERRRQATRELLKTPAGILWVDAELKRVRAEFRAAYSPETVSGES